MHCCVLEISCIQGTTLYPVSCRALSFSQFQPWMSIPVAPVEHVQPFNFKHSTKSGTQSLSLSRAEHAFQQAVSGSFFCGSYALVVACFALCHASFVFPWGWGEGRTHVVTIQGVCGGVHTRKSNHVSHLTSYAGLMTEGHVSMFAKSKKTPNQYMCPLATTTLLSNGAFSDAACWIAVLPNDEAPSHGAFQHSKIV